MLGELHTSRWEKLQATWKAINNLAADTLHQHVIEYIEACENTRTFIISQMPKMKKHHTVHMVETVDEIHTKLNRKQNVGHSHMRAIQGPAGTPVQQHFFSQWIFEVSPCERNLPYRTREVRNSHQRKRSKHMSSNMYKNSNKKQHSFHAPPVSSRRDLHCGHGRCADEEPQGFPNAGRLSHLWPTRSRRSTSRKSSTSRIHPWTAWSLDFWNIREKSVERTRKARAQMPCWPQRHTIWAD